MTDLATSMRQMSTAKQIVDSDVYLSKKMTDEAFHSLQAEKMLVDESSLEKITAAAQAGKTTITADSVGPDYSDKEDNHYVHHLCTDHLKTHLQMLLDNGFTVDFQKTHTYRPTLVVSW